MSIAAFSPTEEDVNAYESLKAELLGQLRKGTYALYATTNTHQVIFALFKIQGKSVIKHAVDMWG